MASAVATLGSSFRYDVGRLHHNRRFADNTAIAEVCDATKA